MRMHSLSLCSPNSLQFIHISLSMHEDTTSVPSILFSCPRTAHARCIRIGNDYKATYRSYSPFHPIGCNHCNSVMHALRFPPPVEA